MALKTSESFFKFVTMGAASARKAIQLLRERDYDAHELERYSTSNKIWQTKIKRLRLPDLFCIRTGARFEVRAKSKLEVKMSDSPTVKGRHWDSGLRDKDVILFVHCEWEDGRARPADRVEAFSVAELRATVETSKLGPPKSAGEGAERDRSWPTVVASQSGFIVEIEESRLRTKLDTGRNQTYQLGRRVNKVQVRLHPYVNEGGEFQGSTQFLAGTPPVQAQLTPSADDWDPVVDLSGDELSRFAAVKALGLRGDVEQSDRIYQTGVSDSEARVRLEAAGSLVRLEDDRGQTLLLDSFENPTSDDLRMESVLIAGEVGNTIAAAFLHKVLDSSLEDEELLSATIWGLGEKGCQDYDRVSVFLGHESDLVASHAAVALGKAIDDSLCERLMGMLNNDDRAAASAAWVLEHATPTVVPHLLALATSTSGARHWAVAILGKRPRKDVEGIATTSPELAASLEAWWKVTGDENWLAGVEASDLIRFVRDQTL
jgi:HEAT repeat protein